MSLIDPSSFASFADLEHEALACTKCPLAETRTQVVFGVGDPRADLLFVAISSPKKEQFRGRHQAAMQVPFAMGVGGSFDVAAGLVRRAPRWMRQAGPEWLFRFLQEPRRMARRYFIDDVAFVWLLLKEVARR